MSDKRAYLVLGPESSGTRLMTRLLIAAGCEGTDEHVQPWDSQTPTAPLIVWRRSLPHGGQWPDVQSLITRLQAAHYSVTALVMSRDWHPMALSQIDNGHVADMAQAIDHVRRAYGLIFPALAATQTPFELVNFESLVARPQQAAAQLMTRLGLPVPECVEVFDANVKHYGGLEAIQGDVETVKATIRERYGFEAPDAYCRDLVSFVEALSVARV